MEINKITELVIGGAIEVHRLLGPGLLESSYEACLTYELKNSGLYIQRQIPVPIMYKDIKLECGYRMDLLVEGNIIVELKTVDVLHPVHTAQILTYLKFAKKPLGLLINFNETLLKKGLRRYRL